MDLDPFSHPVNFMEGWLLLTQPYSLLREKEDSLLSAYLILFQITVNIGR